MSETNTVQNKVYAKTDLGLKRAKNEDRYGVDPELGLLLVADGMGGHMAGEIASKLAVETMMSFVRVSSQDDSTWPFDVDETLPEAANKLKVAVQLANQRIFHSARKRPELEGMGTTIVAAFLEMDRVHIAHVGDSRAYLIRGHRIMPLTSDHSWVNIQLAMGAISHEEARHHPMKNIITRALGTRREVEVDIRTVMIQPGDKLLLCTDGLSGVLKDTEILELIRQNQHDLEGTPEALVQRANERGGDDNVTVVVAHLGEDGRGEDEETRVLPRDGSTNGWDAEET